MDDVARRAGAAAASVGGAGLAAATALVAAVRSARKPLHPRGDIVPGRLVRHRTAPATGVRLLDEPGSSDVLVRRSRALGLPDRLPDIHGLAVRVLLDDGLHGDLLLASTGTGRVSRFTLTTGRTPGARPLTTLLPYRTPTGPVLLAAVAHGEHDYELAYASPGGPWHAFADLTLSSTVGDPLVSFDPVRNPVPGLDNYAWVRRLREPAYLTARLSRRPGRRGEPAT